ncbi:hypothetical protein E05_06550 [Plautia stali symbiont]|nr:hypothetical protein E05_06550 [Plautia stali symbiont]
MPKQAKNCLVEKLLIDFGYRKCTAKKAVNGVKTLVNHGDSQSYDDEKYFQTQLTCIASGEADPPLISV